MGLIDDSRRWIKDQFMEDEHIKGSPKKAIQEVEKHLMEMSPDERKRSVEHVKAYADLYYQGRHKEAIPHEVKQQITDIGKRVERLNTVDNARTIVAKYGGAPSRYTVAESVDRSRSMGISTDSQKITREPVSRQQEAISIKRDEQPRMELEPESMGYSR